MDEQAPSTKEVMEELKAFNELMGLFRQSQKKLDAIMPLFIATAEGDYAKWFEGIDEVSQLDIDDAQGALIVALSAIAKIKVKIKGTAAEDVIEDLFALKDS